MEKVKCPDNEWRYVMETIRCPKCKETKFICDFTEPFQTYCPKCKIYFDYYGKRIKDEEEPVFRVSIDMPKLNKRRVKQGEKPLTQKQAIKRVVNELNNLTGSKKWKKSTRA